jgi:hypothetical protein
MAVIYALVGSWQRLEAISRRKEENDLQSQERAAAVKEKGQPGTYKKVPRSREERDIIGY